ncbi:MAG TPA: ABC transporter substrate-binding protein [Candidatus Sulfotelmatobacter sp.]|jgi:iron complex transport system substrate-binding protein|nr:ABC transporter substrate-binding protein [Candidatus Sulfotelmatobacter sp.]
MRRALIIAGLLVLVALCPSARAEDRVASLNLCSDQAVMALLPRQRIVGLSRWAADPHLSAVAVQAQGIPTLSASAESVLLSNATTVVTGTYGDGKTLALLQKLGVRVIRVPAADSFPEVMTALRAAANDLGDPARGEALTVELQGRIDRLAAQSPEHRPLAAYYRPDGGTAGRGTSVDTAMTAAGYRNLAAELGKQGWTGLDLETLLLHPPEVIITSFFDGRPWSLHNGFAHHPVFRAALDRTRIVDIPGRLWSCGGWPLVDAAETLATAREGNTTP